VSLTEDAQQSAPKGLARLTSAPALHFVALGLLLFALRPAVEFETPGGLQRTHPIRVGADQITRLRRAYVQSMDAQPDIAAMRVLVAREVDDEILYREALEIGMDLKDPVVYRRLLEKMEFLGERRDGESDQQTFQRSLDLGLQSQDPIIRNALIRKISTWIRFATNDAPPDEAELRDYMQRHRQEYLLPAITSFVHVFFSNDRRSNPDKDARATLEALQAAPALANVAKHGLGDPFIQGILQPSQNEHGIARNFGLEFATEVMSLDEGKWSEPIRSAFGFHLVFVTDRQAGGDKEFASIRSQIERGRETELREERLKAKLTELRSVYKIEVADLGFEEAGDAQ
jgi:peptidyl-prolyl cis-trans isomerase C